MEITFIKKRPLLAKVEGDLNVKPLVAIKKLKYIV